MTIQEARRSGTEQLARIYPLGEASTISDWVVEHITGMKISESLAHPAMQLTEEQLARQNQLMERLLTHEPVQYVLGEAWFYGLRFKVDPNVLIPRPETEELVEWVIDNCRFPLGELQILDIGTGSGCIAIALKRRFRKASVWACDYSEGALAVARENAKNLGADVNFIHLDFLSPHATTTLPAFDIIISNPPYIPEQDRSGMDANVVNYEPHLALFVPDNDSLLFYRAISAFGQEHLKEGGNIYLELYEGAGEETRTLFEQEGYRAEIKKDLQGKNRMLRAQR